MKKTVREPLLIFAMIISIPIIFGFFGLFTYSNSILMILIIMQLAIISFILAGIWNLLVGEKDKFKRNLINASILVFLTITSLGIESNINYSSHQLYKKGSNLLKAYDESKNLKGRASLLGIYNPLAIYLAKSYLNRSINSDPEYSEPRVELAKYYLKNREYDKILYQCSFIDDKTIEVLKLESVAHVFLNGIDEAERKNNELTMLGVKSRSIEFLLKEYSRLDNKKLEAEFFLYFYDRFNENL